MSALKSWFRKYLMLLSLGAVAGAVLGTWAAPGLLQHWAPPFAEAQGSACEARVNWTTDRMVEIQAISAGILALAFALLGAAFRRKRPSPSAPPEPEALPTPPDDLDDLTLGKPQ